METVLGYISSMEFWRARRSRASTLSLLKRRKEPSNFRAYTNDGAKPGPDDIQRVERMGFEHSAPVHLIVPDVSLRVRRAHLTCSVFDRRIPSPAFVEVGNGTFVMSPEACFLQEAKTAHFEALVETGFELCGTYRMPATSEGEAQYDQPPLTSIEALRAFIARAGRIAGVDAARKAVPHILPGSASPKESQLAMICCLPGRLGGYGLPQPKLNYPIAVSEKARGRNVGRTCRCDLFWPDAGLDVEYDSHLHHAGGAEQVKDSARRTALAYENILVISVTSEQLHTRTEMDKVANAIAKQLGCRLRTRAVDWEIKHIKLRSRILNGGDRLR